MALNKLFTVLVLSCLTGAATMVAARELMPLKHRQDLAARIENEAGGMVECWNALLELRSCTNEIILFFLNGEASLGFDCCFAIRVITRECWPSMLTNLGFTTEEGDILRGYCDASSPSPLSAFAPVGVIG